VALNWLGVEIRDLQSDLALELNVDDRDTVMGLSCEL
jgi:hypothetical protein